MGAIQVGYLRALHEAGISPDVLVGTSVGALNAAHVALYPGEPGLDRLERLWRRLRDDDLFPGGRLRTPWARMFIRCHSVFDNSGVRGMVRSAVGDASFEDATVPLGVTAADLDSGQEVVFRTGPLAPALIASAAMPGVLPPVEVGGRRYIDGGVVDNVPVAPATAMGATTIYVLDASSNRGERRVLERPFDYLMHAFSMARSQRLLIERPHLERLATIISLPKPPLDQVVSFGSMKHTVRLIEHGYDAAQRFLSRETDAPLPLASDPNPATPYTS